MCGHLNFRIDVSLLISIKLIECLERIVMMMVIFFSLNLRLEKVLLVDLVLWGYNFINIKVLLKVNGRYSGQLPATATPAHSLHLILLIPFILNFLVAHSPDDTFHFQVRVRIHFVESKRIVFFHCTDFFTG